MTQYYKIVYTIGVNQMENVYYIIGTRRDSHIIYTVNELIRHIDTHPHTYISHSANKFSIGINNYISRSWENGSISLNRNQFKVNIGRD